MVEKMNESLDNAVKIWRYMDLSSFISLVVNEAIYFPCATEFHDPFEGHLPVSHNKALISVSQKILDSLSQILKDRPGNIALPNPERLHLRAIE